MAGRSAEWFAAVSSRVRVFTDKDPELNRKLVQFEDAVYALFDIASGSIRLEIAPPVLKAGIIARAGQLVRVFKPVELLLAAPKTDDAGSPLVIWNRSGGTVTVRPIKGTVNGAVSASLAGARAYRLQHDGTDYAGEF